MAEFVHIETDQAVATIRLGRPPMNALNGQVQEEIGSAAARLAADDGIRAVVIYGGERVFAAGADINEMAEASYGRMAADTGRLQAAFTAEARIPKPVVAAITGYALGGGLEIERLNVAGLFATEDQRTGMRSFIENGPGKATFAGR